LNGPPLTNGAAPDLSPTDWVTKHLAEGRALVDELMACTKADDKLASLEQHYPACLDDILSSLATIRAIEGDRRWHRTREAFTQFWTSLYTQLLNWPNTVDGTRAALGTARECVLKLAVKPDPHAALAAYAADTAESAL
jgi:hypothetical protein